MTATTAPRLLLTAVLALLLAVIAVAPASEARSVTPDRENQMVDLINRERAAVGRAPLSSDLQLTRVARDWSFTMGDAGRISHRSNLSSVVSSGWQRLAENVGVGPSIGSLHTGFMNSPGHRANVVGDFDRVGVGVVEQNGRLWVTVNFRKGGSGPVFTDIVGNTHRSGIEALFARGTTTGCNASQFCPSRSVTRGQMATFLTRELGLTPTSTSFRDVPSRHPHAASIGALAASGITSGCSDGRFCPDQPVSRAQMATFLSEAMGLADRAPSGMTDVPSSHPHASSIGALQAAGVTKGCTTRTFCPNQAVTRGQMATFLTRAFG